MKKHTIENLEESSLVTNGFEFALVKYCAHGNKFYSFVGSEEDAERDHSAEEIDNAILVSDWDDVNVDECCG